MLISDHINFMGTNPLIGPNDSEMGVRFPDMSTSYTVELREMAKQVAADLNIKSTRRCIRRNDRSCI